MPLRNENRILVKRGLEKLNRYQREGLKELFIRRNLIGKRLSSRDIAWDISPLLNSAGRMGDAEKAVKLLLSNTTREIVSLSDKIFKLNEQRKALRSTEWNKIMPEARRTHKESEGKFVLVVDDTIHHGNTGILATRLSQYFKAPSLVIALLENRAVGSARSPINIKLTDFLDQFSDILSGFGGHDCAAGFTLSVERIDDFKQRYWEVIRTFQNPEEGEEKISIDAEIPLQFLTQELKKTLELLEPFGEGNPPLTFQTCNILIQDCEIIKGEHLKFLLDTGSIKWPAVFWNGADSVGAAFSPGDRVDIVYKISTNYFRGAENLQLILLDMKK